MSGRVELLSFCSNLFVYGTTAFVFINEDKNILNCDVLNLRKTNMLAQERITLLFMQKFETTALFSCEIHLRALLGSFSSHF